MDTISTYDRAAGTWDKSVQRLGYHHAYQRFLRPHVTGIGPVLDVGTGTGLFAQEWMSAGGSCDLTLMDPSTVMLNAARARFDAMNIAVNTLNVGLEDYRASNCFQTILAAHAIEHCADPAAALRELASQLLPGGRIILVISKPHWCNWLIWLRFRHRWFAPHVVRDWADAAGLTTIETHRFAAGPPARTSLGYVFCQK